MGQWYYLIDLQERQHKEPNNYTGVTLIICFDKMSTVIINERLKKWAFQNEIVSDAQFGFKADFSTVDAIFIWNH